jgi:hypothetical protein
MRLLLKSIPKYGRLGISQSKRALTTTTYDEYMKLLKIESGQRERSALGDYLPGITPSSDIFISHYDTGSSGRIVRKDYTREEFFLLSLKAASLLITCGAQLGDRQAHYFSGNKVEDLVLRTASIFLGTVPVTSKLTIFFFFRIQL